MDTHQADMAANADWLEELNAPEAKAERLAYYEQVLAASASKVGTVVPDIFAKWTGTAVVPYTQADHDAISSVVTPIIAALRS